MNSEALRASTAVVLGIAGGWLVPHGGVGAGGVLLLVLAIGTFGLTLFGADHRTAHVAVFCASMCATLLVTLWLQGAWPTGSELAGIFFLTIGLPIGFALVVSGIARRREKSRNAKDPEQR